MIKNKYGFIVVLLTSFSFPVFASDSAVDIDLSEWKLTMNKNKVKAGSISFDVSNTGKEVHELAIIKLNNIMISDAGLLPVNNHGAIDEDGMKFGKVVGEIEDIGAGSKASKHFKLESGRYAIICNITETEPDGSIEAHFAMGMRAILEVQ